MKGLLLIMVLMLSGCFTDFAKDDQIEIRCDVHLESDVIRTESAFLRNRKDSQREVKPR